MNLSEFLHDLFFTVLFTNGLSVIWNKYNLTGALSDLSMKVKSRFIYNLSNCEFCIEHHLAIIPTVILILMINFTVEHTFIPFITSSLLQLIKTFKNANNRG